MCSVTGLDDGFTCGEQQVGSAQRDGAIPALDFGVRHRQTSMSAIPAGGLAEYFTKKNSEDRI